MIFELIKIIITWGIVTEAQGEFQQSHLIEPLTNTSGLYKELLGSIHFTTNNWKIDVRVDMSEFKNDLSNLMRSINTTKVKCKENSGDIGCEVVSRELFQRETMIEKKISELFSIIHSKEKHTFLKTHKFRKF
ncbi:hypothetical protein ACFFRR_005459 [Megaselia abdita]